MKTSIFKSVSLLIILATTFGCSSDSDSSTSSPCPQGFTGSNCNIPITPTKVKILKFKVTSFSNLDNSGGSWDSSPNVIYPDIYLQLNSYITPTYYNDVLYDGTNSFEFTPTTPLEITTVNDIHTIYLGDWDLNDIPSNSNDLMAQINFYPYQAINGFPTTLSLSNYLTPVPFKVELTLAYEW